MDEFTGLDHNTLCSDSDIEAFLGATSSENRENYEVSLKKEPIVVDDVPQPLKGLYEEGPTPFIKKTHAMVEDAQTDAVISWSESGMSFVIWDQYKFCVEILPKNFKHSNFSSFIRQLNTYGFKKLSLDRWEYANENFQKGKDHLLKNIKRKRYQSDQHVLRDERSSQLSLYHENLEKETELKKLKSDTDKLRIEVLNIQKEQESAENYLLSVKERLIRTEHKQQQMFICMAKAFKNPMFNEILMQQLRGREALDTADILKKQKLMAPQCNKSPLEATYYAEGSLAKDDFAMTDTEIRKASFYSGTRRPVVHSQKVTEVLATKPSAIASDNSLLLEDLLADDVVSETKAATEQENIHSKVVLELEELITNVSATWDVSMKEMVEQAVCMQPQF